MRDGDVNGLWHALEKGLSTALVLGHLPWLIHYLDILPTSKNLNGFRKFSVDRVVTRKNEGSAEKDLFYHLIDEGGVDPIPPTTVEVTSDGSLAIIAGSDTTAGVLSAVIWFILGNPHVYRRLQKETDDLGDDLLNSARLAHLPYLNAVINETLRLLPPLPMGSHRAPAPGSGGKSIGPAFITEGTSALIHFYSVHRDPRNFSPLPETFVPERWLTPEDRQASAADLPLAFTDPAQKSTHNTAAFVPFSFGPAMCVGKNLAYQEMRVVVSVLMRRFEMRFAEGFVSASWEEGLEDFLLFKRGKLPIVLSPRP